MPPNHALQRHRITVPIDALVTAVAELGSRRQAMKEIGT